MAQGRLFVGAAEAAGAAELTVDAPTVGALRAALGGVARLGTVLDRCALLVDGRRASDDAEPVPASATVDVLPPFAGG